VLVAAALTACSPSLPVDSRVAAITNGTNDDTDAGVVAFVQGQTLICTATLVAPRVLLTAAHCLPDGGMPLAYFGIAPGDGGPELAITAVRRHPAFDATTLQNDVAMALLDSAAPPGATSWPLPAVPLDDSAVGTTLRLVGFGRTAAGDTSAPRKREGTTTLASLTATELDFAPSPSQTCEGDSGGPAFATVGGVEAIVGVTSSGDASCAAMARDMRVDAYAATFIAPWIAATAEGAAGAGDRCWYASNCATGECAPALDDPSLSFCAPPCDGGCPAGLACLADSDGSKLCRHAPPSPGAAGSSCTSDDACNFSDCVARQSGGATVCAKGCFVDLPGFCADGFECAPTTAAGGKAACFARAHGCAFAGAPGDDYGALVLFALALTACARGGRRWSARCCSARPRG
jgi:V8-like Glu-specific endopeptidase